MIRCSSTDCFFRKKIHTHTQLEKNDFFCRDKFLFYSRCDVCIMYIRIYTNNNNRQQYLPTYVKSNICITTTAYTYTLYWKYTFIRLIMYTTVYIILYNTLAVENINIIIIIYCCYESCFIECYSPGPLSSGYLITKHLKYSSDLQSQNIFLELRKNNTSNPTANIALDL